MSSPSPRRSSRYSRSRSPSTRYARRYSRSRSPRDSSRSARRSHSRSPMSNRRRHIGCRDAPAESKCLGVFGINLYTTERELEREFGKFGPLEKVQIILDGKTGRSRGFGFVYFESVEDARAAKEALNGQEIDNRKIRVDYSITKRAHTPTPGVYMGRPTFTGRDEGYQGNQQGYRRGGYDGGSGYGGSSSSRGSYHRRGGGHQYGREGVSHYERDGGYYEDGGRRTPPDLRYRSSRRDYRSRSRSYSPRNRSYY